MVDMDDANGQEGLGLVVDPMEERVTYSCSDFPTCFIFGRRELNGANG
jgi:hypothetical protein